MRQADGANFFFFWQISQRPCRKELVELRKEYEMCDIFYLFICWPLFQLLCKGEASLQILFLFPSCEPWASWRRELWGPDLVLAVIISVNSITSRGLGGRKKKKPLFLEAASQPKLRDAGAQRFRYSRWRWTQLLNLHFREAFNLSIFLLFFFLMRALLIGRCSGPFEKLEASPATTSVPVCGSTGDQREDEKLLFFYFFCT